MKIENSLFYSSRSDSENIEIAEPVNNKINTLISTFFKCFCIPSNVWPLYRSTLKSTVVQSFVLLTKLGCQEKEKNNPLFDDLPLDVIGEIYQFLDKESTFRFGSVSKKCNATLKTIPSFNVRLTNLIGHFLKNLNTENLEKNSLSEFQINLRNVPVNVYSSKNVRDLKKLKIRLEHNKDISDEIDSTVVSLKKHYQKEWILVAENNVRLLDSNVVFALNSLEKIIPHPTGYLLINEDTGKIYMFISDMKWISRFVYDRGDNALKAKNPIEIECGAYLIQSGNSKISRYNFEIRIPETLNFSNGALAVLEIMDTLLKARNQIAVKEEKTFCYHSAFEDMLQESQNQEEHPTIFSNNRGGVIFL